MSRMPPPRWKRGSPRPPTGMLTSPPSRTSLTLRSWDVLRTASRTSVLARRRKRCLFSRLFPPGLRRRSMKCMAPLPQVSAGLLHAHVPFDQPANLALGVAALHHPLDKLAVLLFGIAVLFRTERDHRKQIFDLREDALLDDLADLFIAGPGRILAAVLGPLPQRELDHLVAECLGGRDATGSLNRGDLLVHKLAVQHLTGLGLPHTMTFYP